tara:strand:- start:596 stop:1279 length:684 start_codon:yes stop_codon:yes gene_type:complete
MDYFKIYRRKLVGGLKKATKYQLKPGQIAIVRYTSSIGKGNAPFKILFVLNIWRSLGGTKLHAIELSKIPWLAFRIFIKLISVRDTISLLKRRYEVKAPVLKIVDNPRIFYSKWVKRRLDKYDCYRTLNMTGISSVKVGYLDFKMIYSDYEQKEMLISDNDKIQDLGLEKKMLEKTLEIKLDKLTDLDFRRIIIERYGSVKTFVKIYKKIEKQVDELDSNANLGKLK